MAYEMKDGQGSLFKNDKRGNDKAPDEKGTAMFEGVEIEISGWHRTAKSGVQYTSLSIQRKRKSAQAQQAESANWRE